MRPLLAVCAGALLPLSLAPFDWWPLSLVSAALLFWCLQGVTAGTGLWLGWLYGIGKYALGVSWVYVSIHEHGHASALLSGFLVLLFVSALAVFPAAASWFYARFLYRAGNADNSADVWLVNGVSFIVVLVLLEWALTWVLTGFPWLYYGYAHLATALGHWAPVGGVLLVSAMAILSATMAVVVVAEKRVRPRMIAAVFMVLPWLGGFWMGSVRWVEPFATGQVALVQGDIDQETKWRQDSVLPIIERYSRLSRDQWGKDLVIWPEAALTLFRFQAWPVLQKLSRRGRQAGTTLVLGIPDLTVLPGGTRVFRNTALALGNGSGSYVKQRLVPFGEYVPLESWLRGLIEFFDLPMSHAEPGVPDQRLLQAGPWRLAVAICYEIVYPELVRRAATTADLIVTISNDTWFGDSIGPLQHMQMARMRALENGRYLLRDTNNGVTAIVDERGRVTARLPQFVAAVLEGEFVVMRGHTPFSRWGFLPELIVLGLWLVLALLYASMVAVFSQKPEHPAR